MKGLARALIHLRQDPVLRTLVEQYGVLNYRPNKDRFSSLAREIISQQLSGKVADVIWDRFEKLCADQISPARILTLAREHLRSAGMSWAKADFVLDLANRVQNGQLVLLDLNQKTDAEVVAYLCQVKGIGKWTAEMSLMFTFHRPDIFPLDDVGIQNAFVKLYGLNRKHKTLKKKMEKIASAWRPWRTVACWYLWRVLDNS